MYPITKRCRDNFDSERYWMRSISTSLAVSTSPALASLLALSNASAVYSMKRK